MKSQNPKLKSQNPEMVVIDAERKPFGRVASEAAVILQGKRSPAYQRHLILGPAVKVVNVGKAALTGRKLATKVYWHHTGYIGHLKEEKLAYLFSKDPAKLFRRTVSGMLPKNSLRPRLLKRLIIIP
jgi:large subunit ribosomal protein L13